MGRWVRWLRQLVYALLLFATIMAAARLQWLGMPALERYVIFFLTEPMDFRQVEERLPSWLRWPPEGWRLPWQRGDSPGEPADAPADEGDVPSRHPEPGGGPAAAFQADFVGFPGPAPPREAVVNSV